MFEIAEPLVETLIIPRPGVTKKWRKERVKDGGCGKENPASLDPHCWAWQRNVTFVFVKWPYLYIAGASATLL